jgi:hypothetical protein
LLVIRAKKEPFLYLGAGLVMLLDIFYLAQATDHRDLIYGLLGISQEQSLLEQQVKTGIKSNLPIPNYEHSLREVYIDWSRYLIESSGKLELLSRTIVIDNIQEDNSSTSAPSHP